MKRYFIYAIILGLLGNALLTNASQMVTNRTTLVLEQVGN